MAGRREEQRERVEALAEAYEAGRFEESTALAEALLAAEPRAVEALHYLAASQVELGDLEAARASYARALAVAPKDLEILVGAAELLICSFGEERADVEEGLALCERAERLARKGSDDEIHFELLLLLGVGHNQLGEAGRAVRWLRRALELEPASLEGRLELAVALFELCRFEDAKRELSQLVVDAPDEAVVHHYLGLIAEREGKAAAAEQSFEQARALAPEDFPPPVVLEDEDFDAVVEAAVAKLPPRVRVWLENTTFAVEPLPAEADLLAEEPPLSPLILGLFRGVAIGERSVSSAQDHFPASIFLYQRNLERFARTRDELVAQIGITVMHEVGHLIGLDEEDLWERGLE